MTFCNKHEINSQVMLSCASFPEDSSMDVVKSKRGLATHKERDRRDVISDSKYPCKLCKKKPARMRDIRVHIVDKHEKASFFRCKVTNFSGIRCDFECHYSMACFTNHTRRIHREFYNGIRTTLDDEDSFKLVIVELN